MWLLKLPFRILGYLLRLLKILVIPALLLTVVLAVLHLAGIIEIPGLSIRTPITVHVIFEVQSDPRQMINDYIQYVFDPGPGHEGEWGNYHGGIESEEYYLLTGTNVRVWAGAVGENRLVCRVIVNGKELYLDGNMGRDVEVECAGPVFEPPDDK